MLPAMIEGDPQTPFHQTSAAITRRRLVTLAAMAALPLFPNQPRTIIYAAETDPKIDILDSSYADSQLLVSNLRRPQSVTINPSDNRVYFVQKSEGNSERIFELDQNTAIPKYIGAGDPYGSGQQTEIAINGKGQLLVYTNTYIGEEVYAMDLNTGSEVFRIQNPFQDASSSAGRVQLVRSLAANPRDDKFYMTIFREDPLVSVDNETGAIVKYNPKNISWRYNMCFDGSGTAYLGDGFDESIDVVKPGKDGQSFKFQKMAEAIGQHERFSIMKLKFDPKSGKIIMIVGAKKDASQVVFDLLPKHILAVDINSHVVSPIARLSSNSSLEVTGLDVNSTGDIYLSTHDSLQNDNGRIYRIPRG